MSSKQPVLLVVLIETSSLRWFVGGVDLDGRGIPLMASEPGNLRTYIGLPVDEQVSFLRHRLAGVLQRGCDRLWAREMKPCQIVFLTDAPFPEAEPDLAQRVGQHFHEWMTNPPVVFIAAFDGYDWSEKMPMFVVAGTMPREHFTPLTSGLATLFAALDEPTLWEAAPIKKAP